MREFVYYSENAPTTGNFNTENLMKAGRIDIACNVVIMSLFVSHFMRDDVKLHMVFDGPPDKPKHLEIFPSNNLDNVENKIDISKKDIAGLIKRMLYKYKKGEKREISSGYSIEKKSLLQVIEELQNQGKTIYVLDKKGEDIRNIEINGKEVFILGDQDGIPKLEMKKLKNMEIKKVSVGPQMYFASQVVVILNNEIDRKEVV
jgi:tRNA (pseudouridine54-N1)-methyltransferase